MVPSSVPLFQSASQEVKGKCVLAAMCIVLTVVSYSTMLAACADNPTSGDQQLANGNVASSQAQPAAVHGFTPKPAASSAQPALSLKDALSR